MYLIPKIEVDEHEDPEDLSVDVEDEDDNETSLSPKRHGQGRIV